MCWRVTSFHRCDFTLYIPISSLPESFSFIYSTPSPFTCGYFRLVMCVNLYSLTKFLKSVQLYCVPLSDIEFSGILCWLIASFRAAMTVLLEATSYFNAVWKTIHVKELLRVVFFQKKKKRSGPTHGLSGAGLGNNGSLCSALYFTLVLHISTILCMCTILATEQIDTFNRALTMAFCVSFGIQWGFMIFWPLRSSSPTIVRFSLSGQSGPSSGRRTCFLGHWVLLYYMSLAKMGSAFWFFIITFNLACQIQRANTIGFHVLPLLWLRMPHCSKEVASAEICASVVGENDANTCCDLILISEKPFCGVPQHHSFFSLNRYLSGWV